MAFHSDTQLRNMGLQPLRDIPNREGVRIYLKSRDNFDVPAIVRRRAESNLHYCDHSTAFVWGDFIGWKPA